MPETSKPKRALSQPAQVSGQCLCGAVRFEIDAPARWAWHDHTRATRTAHGAAYATYVGSWRKRFRLTDGADEIARYEDKETRSVRGFCKRCGTPVTYERARSPHMVNIPRALFSEPHRPPAAVSHRHRRAAGVDLHRRAAGAAEGVSGRGVGAASEEEGEGVSVRLMAVPQRSDVRRNAR